LWHSAGSPSFYITAFDKDFADEHHCAELWLIGKYFNVFECSQSNPALSVA